MADETAAGKGEPQVAAALEGNPIASVDWLTVTAKEERNRWRLRGLAGSILRAEERAGNERSQRSSRWYWVERCGSTSVGERDEDSMVSVSGATAAAHWTKLAGPAERCSRLDLAVTVCLTSAYPGRCRDAYAALASASRGRGRPISARLIQSLPRGVTLYLGAPQSEQMGRLYDKGAESESHPDGVRWRYEVQLKNAHALLALREIERHAEPEDVIGAIVHRWFRKRGVQPEWDPKKVSCGSLQPVAPASDDATRLAWLRASVGPTIRKLAERGLLDEALTALGIEPTIQRDGDRPAGSRVS